MKKILFIILLSTFVNAFSQDHIKFMGHYVDEQDYIETLLSEGKITHLKKNCYKGTVAGDDMFIMFMNGHGHISGVTMCKMKNENWNDCKMSYLKMKSLFSEKYEIERCTEYTGLPDGLKESSFAFKSIKDRDGKFQTKFKIPNGSIILEISPMDNSAYPEYGSIMILYRDEKYIEEDINSERKSQLDDL